MKSLRPRYKKGDIIIAKNSSRFYTILGCVYNHSEIIDPLSTMPFYKGHYYAITEFDIQRSAPYLDVITHDISKEFDTSSIWGCSSHAFPSGVIQNYTTINIRDIDNSCELAEGRALELLYGPTE